MTAYTDPAGTRKEPAGSLREFDRIWRGEEVVEARYGHEGVEIGFNAEYLLEILGAAGAATSIQMQVKDAQSAAEFQPSGNGQGEYTYLLMRFACNLSPSPVDGGPNKEGEFVVTQDQERKMEVLKFTDQCELLA